MVNGLRVRQSGRVETVFPIFQRGLAAQVRQLRLSLGMTQERLAAAADIDVRHIQRIEAGRANPELNTLCALAVALCTIPSALLVADPKVEDPAS